MQGSTTKIRMRGIFIAAGMTAVFAAQTVAAASCPPGYRGTYPHCVPVPQQARPHRPYTMKSNAHLPSGVTTTHPKPHAMSKMLDREKVGPPVGPGPVEHHANATEQRGIIFVGGKNAINSQPVPPGHSLHDQGALNPQPIPPGHSLRRIPHPAVPIEKTIGH